MLLSLLRRAAEISSVSINDQRSLNERETDLVDPQLFTPPPSFVCAVHA
jgi:hypothetical protein